jgi:hypothetical protein
MAVQRKESEMNSFDISKCCLWYSDKRREDSREIDSCRNELEM